mgnify:CR=1 FL=1
MPKRTIAENLAERAGECHAQALAGTFADLAVHLRAELPLHLERDPSAPNLSRVVADLERQAGRAPPVGTLSGWDVLRLADSRARD